MVMVLLERRQPPRGRLAVPELPHILFAALLGGGGHDLTGPVLVGRVVE